MILFASSERLLGISGTSRSFGILNIADICHFQTQHFTPKSKEKP